MNKDLARVSAVWRALFGVRGPPLLLLIVYLSKSPPKMVFGGVMAPSLETGAVRCCTVGELLRDCDLVSVLGVQEKCDEKGQALTRLAFPCRHFEASRENNFRRHEPAEHHTRQSRKPAPETFRTLSASRV